MTAGASTNLRPLTLGQLLDQSIRLYRHNFFTFVGIMAVVLIPVVLLQMVMSVLTLGSVADQLRNAAGSPPDPLVFLDPGYVVGIAGTLIVSTAGFFLIQGVATAAMTRAVADSYLGEPVGVLAAYRKIGQAWFPLVVALVLALLVTAGLLLWSVVPCLGWFTGAGLLVFFWFAIVPLIAPVVVLEQQNATQSLRRSWDLARRRFWWVLGFVIVLMLFSLLIITGPSIAFNFLIQALTGGPTELNADQLVIRTVSQSLVTLVFSLLYLPLRLTGVTLMYFDLRVRTEGFDLALAAAGPASEQTATATVMTQAPRPETASLLNRRELGYFAVLSLAAVGVYVVIILPILLVIGLAALAVGQGLPGF